MNEVKDLKDDVVIDLLTLMSIKLESKSTYVGFSSALGSSLPKPAGLFSASSDDIKMSSASTLP